MLADAEIEELTIDFVRSAYQAQRIGFDLVNIKHCHGYLGHEILRAYSRPGKYGGSFENRTRFLREIVTGIRSECPRLEIGVRVSIFDFPPFRGVPLRRVNPWTTVTRWAKTRLRSAGSVKIPSK